MIKFQFSRYLCFLFLLVAPWVTAKQEVTVKHTADEATIGNEYLAREFTLKNGRVRTAAIVNKRTGDQPTRIVPEASSEEFVIGTLVNDSVPALLRASMLTLGEIKTGTGEDGAKLLTFSYKPYRLEGVDWQVDMVFAMQPGKHYMRKYLEISVPEAQRKQARIDYIDSESLKIPAGYATWTHPEMENGVGGVSGYYISLGQPVYIQAVFFGLEFPATESEITKDNVAHIRYYSGKSFDQLQAENRLDGDTFTTWKQVIGATRSTDMDVIQSDFFSYIQDISTPIDLRMQYNSWYDFMMDIDESNILGSFWEIERGLTQYGVRPLDSYVVDDGWNAYGPYQKENTAKFWSFNSKFPNGLSTPTGLAHRFASDFGLWLGPRGGYNYNNDFAQFLQDNGNGMRNAKSWDIATNHKVYIEKLKTFFLDCQKKYDINYWKLDGFMITPPQPDPAGNYISGGYKGMYYVTEHWERWIDIFRAMRDFRGDGRDELWINLTCYMNPSPWFLQWANSVWIQNSGDMGRLNVGRKAAVDELLTYRDDRYFDFVKTRAFQFPLAHVYNHDPIYGNTAGLEKQMNDDEFRTYLLMMATRGTAFWELYYSYNMMDEGNKWAINAEALKWIEENYPILQHAKLIGSTPAKKSAYGFSAWKGDEGIISVRNPAAQVQAFDIVLDRNIGMREGLKNLYRTSVWSFNAGQPDDNSGLFAYGDKISLTLQPGEVRIWKFGTTPDKKAPAVRTVKAVSPVKLTVEFDEPVQIRGIQDFVVEGNVVSGAAVQADRRTVDLTVISPMEPATRHRLQVAGVTDYSGNAAKAKVPFRYFERQLIPADVGISGVSDFNIAFRLNTQATDMPVMNQGKDIRIRITPEGKLAFRVKGVNIESSVPVNTGRETLVSLCREKNGMLKIYLDGRLDGSAYDPAIVNPVVKAARMKINPGLQPALSGLSITDYAWDYKTNEKAAK